MYVLQRRVRRDDFPILILEIVVFVAVVDTQQPSGLVLVFFVASGEDWEGSGGGRDEEVEATGESNQHWAYIVRDGVFNALVADIKEEGLAQVHQNAVDVDINGSHQRSPYCGWSVGFHDERRENCSFFAGAVGVCEGFHARLDRHRHTRTVCGHSEFSSTVEGETK